MKLKEWGLMRHKGRKARLEQRRGNSSGRNDEGPRGPSATAEPMPVDSGSLEHYTEPRGSRVVSSGELTIAEPTFMGTPRYVFRAISHMARTDPNQLTTIYRNTNMDARCTSRIERCSRHAWMHPGQ